MVRVTRQIPFSPSQDVPLTREQFFQKEMTMENDKFDKTRGSDSAVLWWYYKSLHGSGVLLNTPVNPHSGRGGKGPPVAELENICISGVEGLEISKKLLFRCFQNTCTWSKVDDGTFFKALYKMCQDENGNDTIVLRRKLTPPSPAKRRRKADANDNAQSRITEYATYDALGEERKQRSREQTVVFPPLSECRANFERLGLEGYGQMGLWTSDEHNTVVVDDELKTAERIPPDASRPRAVLARTVSDNSIDGSDHAPVVRRAENDNSLDAYGDDDDIAAETHLSQRSDIEMVDTGV